MNDQFLYQYQQRPRPEFAEELYQRVSRQRRGPVLSYSRGSPLTGLAQSLHWMGVTMAVLFALSPDVRAQVYERVVQGVMGGLTGASH